MLGDANQAEWSEGKFGNSQGPSAFGKKEEETKGAGVGGGGEGTVGRQLIYACTSANVFTAISISEAEGRR